MKTAHTQTIDDNVLQMLMTSAPVLVRKLFELISSKVPRSINLFYSRLKHGL